MRKLVVFSITLLFCFASVSANNTKRPLKIDDFFRLKAVGNPVVSPDGKWIAFHGS